MERKQGLGPFLFSTANVYGIFFALFGLLLFRLGAIGPYWWLIVAGLYALGYIVAPRNPKVDFEMRNQRSAKELRLGLDRLVSTSRRRLPKDLFMKVRRIRDSIVEVLPQISDLDSADPNIYTIRQTAVEYLPEALQNYMALPPIYANLHHVRDGKTARQLLSEQLDLLEMQVKEMVTEIRQEDVDRLVIHGRFLRDKFQEDRHA